MPFGLNQKTIQQLKEVFRKYPEISQVKIYGSRATGDHSRGSDIDLAFFSDSKKDLSPLISRDLNELPTPYLFDVVDYNHLGRGPLKKEIDGFGRTLYKNRLKQASSAKQPVPAAE